MTAAIVIDPGGDPVVGSRVFDSTFENHAFAFSNNDNTGVLGWKWEWLDTPFVSPTLDPPPADSYASTLSVTPDVAGWSIRIRLTTYTDVARTVVDDTDTVVLGVRFATPYDWLLPASGQSVELDSSRGWSRELNRILDDVNTNLGTSGNAGAKPLSAVPATPHADDVEFDSTTAPAGWVLRNQTAGVDVTPTSGVLEYSSDSGLTRWDFHTDGRASFMRLQLPSASGAAAYLYAKSVTVGTNRLLFVRMSGPLKALFGTGNAEWGIGFFGDTSGHPSLSTDRVFLRMDTAGAQYYLVADKNVATVNTFVKLVATTLNDAAGQEDLAGANFEYLAIHKIGTTYHFWVLTDGGQATWVGSTVHAGSMPWVGIYVNPKTFSGPTSSPVWRVDFIRHRDDDKVPW